MINLHVILIMMIIDIVGILLDIAMTLHSFLEILSFFFSFFFFESNEHLNLCEEIREKDVILSCELVVIKIQDSLIMHMDYYHFQVVYAVVEIDTEHCKY
jgi:hypothetical protein